MSISIAPKVGAAVLGLLAPLASFASPTVVIDFNSLASSATPAVGTPLTNQYAGLGFEFQGVVRVFSSANLPAGGSLQAPCDSNPATPLVTCNNVNANDGFAAGSDFRLVIDSSLEFNVMTLSVTGIDVRFPPNMVVNGSQANASLNPPSSSVGTTLGAPASGPWTWIDSQMLTDNTDNIGFIRSIDFNGAVVIDNITLSLVGSGGGGTGGGGSAPEPASLALALLALGGIGLSRRKH